MKLVQLIKIAIHELCSQWNQFTAAKNLSCVHMRVHTPESCAPDTPTCIGTYIQTL